MVRYPKKPAWILKDEITLPFGKQVSKRSCSSKQLIVLLSSETWLNKGSYWVKSFNFPLSDFVRLELLLLLSKGGPVNSTQIWISTAKKPNIAGWKISLQTCMGLPGPGKDLPCDTGQHIHNLDTNGLLRKYSECEGSLFARLKSCLELKKNIAC
mgnify:CR=1 FL=1